MRISSLLTAIPLLVWMSLVTATAQQPAPTPPQQEEVPTFSADGTVIVEPVPEKKESGENAEKTTQEGELTDEEREDLAEEEGQEGKKKGPSAAELAWRKRLAAAEKAVSDAEQQFMDAELKVTELRNEGTKRGSDTRFQAELEQQGKLVDQARQKVAAARQALDKVRAEGAAKKWSAAPSAEEKATAKPVPKTTAIRGQYSTAKKNLDSVNKRIKLYQHRVSELNLKLTVNSGSGDNYAQAGIQEQLDEANSELERAKGDLPGAQAAFDRARRAASSAGVNVRDIQ